jgi:drug/metabolite transporter (DMT)-like permease
MLKYAAIPVGALLSAAAQIMLKRTSGLAALSTRWIVFFLLSAALYGLSMLVYLYLLRMHPMSTIYPVVTLLVILVISVYGLLIGEPMTLTHIAGLACGVGSIILLLA